MNPAIIIAKERLNHTTLSFVERICAIGWPRKNQSDTEPMPAKIKMTVTTTMTNGAHRLITKTTATKTTATKATAKTTRTKTM